MANIIDLNGADIDDAKLSYPYQALQAVINATWNLALTQSDALDAKLATAQSGFLDEANTPLVTAGSVAIPSVLAPDVTIPETADVSSIMSTFDTKYLELVQMLYDKFSGFIGTYFPNEAAGYEAVESWLRDAVNDPSSGLPRAVREQIWEEDRSRILADASRASDAIIKQAAARRFPLPPGAATSALIQVQQKSQDELAESSRKVAIMSVENVRFAIDKALTLRQTATGSAIEYIKALASGPDMASRVVNVGYDAQSKLISSAAQFYSADTNAKEMVSKVAQYNNSIQLDAATKNQAAELTIIDDKLKALISECQTIATRAASLFNNIHASTGTSGSVSNSSSTTLDLTP